MECYKILLKMPENTGLKLEMRKGFDIRKNKECPKEFQNTNAKYL
jgi:hypothetical protein